MPKKQSPILDFRKSSEATKPCDDSQYDIKIGGRINAAGKMKIESEKSTIHSLATRITESREAVDSSENS
ncbi:MAG: hypothetical protein JSS79_20650 [Bacteroidetes bacterium]|nr:hypothetical protein [Bacteroidota bacterium]